jgi:hypothetical protein
MQNQEAAGHKDLWYESAWYIEDANGLLELYRLLQHDASGHHWVSKYRPTEYKGPENVKLVSTS